MSSVKRCFTGGCLTVLVAKKVHCDWQTRFAYTQTVYVLHVSWRKSDRLTSYTILIQVDKIYHKCTQVYKVGKITMVAKLPFILGKRIVVLLVKQLYTQPVLCVKGGLEKNGGWMTEQCIIHRGLCHASNQLKHPYICQFTHTFPTIQKHLAYSIYSYTPPKYWAIYIFARFSNFRIRTMKSLRNSPVLITHEFKQCSFSL